MSAEPTPDLNDVDEVPGPDGLDRSGDLDERDGLVGLPLFARITTAPAAAGGGRVRGAFSFPVATPTAGSGGERRPRPVPALPVGGVPPAAPASGVRVVPLAGHRPRGSAFVPDAGAAGASGVGVDWGRVAVFRAEASEGLSAALGDGRAGVDGVGQRELGRAIVTDLLVAEAAADVAAGRTPWTLAEQDALARAVFDALFRLGRLQPLVDDDRVENIIITGCDRVRLELTDGTQVVADPVAESDRELVDFLTFLASRSEVNARPFSPACPRLHLRLDDGSRLAATAWVTPRPSVVIRRHRLRTVTLNQLIDLGTLSPVAGSFLAAAVRARRSIVVAGAQGAGKTTLVRALCAEIPPGEAIGTFETEYELHLHDLPDLHPIVHAWEARPGSGERGPDGRPAGEFTLDEALYDSFRFNLSRQIVGEVRGREVLAMIKAMESGTGSLSTTHATDATAALRKLVTCALEAGPHVTVDYATRAVAENIDLVVQLQLTTTPDGRGGARRDRWVSEIIAVSPGERDTGWATTHVFRPSGQGPAVPAVLPDDLAGELSRFGFDPATFHTEATLHSSGGGVG